VTSSLKILNHVYEVYLGDRDVFESPRYGDIRNDLLRIRIDKHTTERIMLVTLMHEALHGISWQLSMDDLPEPMVRTLAHSLIGFLEANGVDLSPLEEVYKNAEEQVLDVTKT
jgi:hypothetical protein